MDAAYITCMRTGAAGAIGAKTLARRDSRNLFILGAGKQTIYQIAATLILLPQINKVFIADPIDYTNAEKLSQRIQADLATNFGIERAYSIDFQPVTNMEDSVGESDVIITVTPSRLPIIKKEWVKPGTHFSCIGADMEGKEEIDPEIFLGAKVFADDKDQCMRVGEMEIPIKQEKISPDDVKGEIGDVLTGKISGRESDSDITIFDATGLAILDLVTGKVAIESARAKGLGIRAEI
ncbi:ornithine cyclodeaminase family protein [Aminipila terrae]|uniref:ornithine cyclodeaminase family protein n=1 Tax=Aminipila terrae TaxID=2697030 RepID=UPI00192F6DC4|nr:ornithine cyclodeaminase family protein [Aminipila terrae]